MSGFGSTMTKSNTANSGFKIKVSSFANITNDPNTDPSIRLQTELNHNNVTGSQNLQASKTSRSVLCIPGQRLCPVGPKCLASEGTYAFNGYIYASQVGRVSTTQRDNLTLVKVSGAAGECSIPEVGSVVTARVLVVQTQLIRVSILAVGNNLLYTPFRGTVKKTNVRDHLVDKVEMYECYRPDDIILARVLSLGDARSYELSTSDSELGVVTARCEEGHLLVPASWTTMKCVCRTEKRKVAKVVPSKSAV